MLEISFSIIKLLYNVKYDTFFIVNLVHVYIKQYDSVIRLRLPNDKIIKPGPSSEYIFKQCTLHVCSGLLMWTVFFLFHSRIFFSKKRRGRVACTHVWDACTHVSRLSAASICKLTSNAWRWFHRQLMFEKKSASRVNFL